METQKPKYEPPMLVEFGDAAQLTQGCNATGDAENDCGKKDSGSGTPSN